MEYCTIIKFIEIWHAILIKKKRGKSCAVLIHSKIYQEIFCILEAKFEEDTASNDTLSNWVMRLNNRYGFNLFWF